MSSVNLLCWLTALVLLAAGASDAHAQPKDVKFNNTWKGSVENADLQKGAPEVITSAKGLEKLWKDWMITDKMPMVDFTKEIVVLGTTGGSILNLSARLDDKGNLQVLGMATLDIRPGFRYVIATVSNDGVKTVNKKALPK